MTIGIGFKCEDGIVLATDTQYSQGDYKSHGPKMFDFFTAAPHPDLAVLVAGAGGVSYMRMAISQLESRLRSLTNPSLEDVKNATVDTLVAFFARHIYPIPAYKQDYYIFELIVGVWTRRDGFGLFKTDGTSITEEVVHGGHCGIGEGLPLAAYALELTCERGGVTVENAKFLAAFCIKAAKEKVQSCGGKTRIFTLKDDGSGFIAHHVIPVEVSDAEEYSGELFQLIQFIVTCIDVESPYDDETVGGMTEMLRNSLIEFRRKQVERRDRIRKAKERLKKPLTLPVP